MFFFSGDCCSIQDLITDETIVPGSTITKYVGENFDGLVAQYRVTDGSGNFSFLIIAESFLKFGINNGSKNNQIIFLSSRC